MKLLTALEDFQVRTLAAVGGKLPALAYVLNLREKGGAFCHWGMERSHGEERARAAIRASYEQLRREALRTSFVSLLHEGPQNIAGSSLDESELEDMHLSLVCECLAEARNEATTRAA